MHSTPRDPSLAAAYPLASLVLQTLDDQPPGSGPFAALNARFPDVPRADIWAAADWLADSGYLARPLVPPATPRALPLAPGRDAFERPLTLQAGPSSPLGASEMKHKHAEQSGKQEEQQSKQAQERKGKRDKAHPEIAAADMESEAKHNQEAGHKQQLLLRAHQETARKHQHEQMAKRQGREQRAEARVKHREEHHHKLVEAREAHAEQSSKRQQERHTKRAERRQHHEQAHKQEQRARAAAHLERLAAREQQFKHALKSKGDDDAADKLQVFEIQTAVADYAAQAALARAGEERMKLNDEQSYKSKGV